MDAGAAFIVLSGFLVVFAVSYKPAYLYDQILRAYSHGDWQRAESLIERLAKSSSLPALQFDLAVRRACISARHGKLDEALALIEPWRSKMCEPAGMFCGRLASIYFAAGDTAGFLAQMRESYEQAPQDQARAIDMALALSMFGDPDEALATIGKVDASNLPTQHSAFIHWVTGLALLRKGDTENALQKLAQATQIFTEFAANPAMWSSLALCTASLSLALARTGDRPKAAAFLRPLYPIFKAHGDKAFVALVEGEVGVPAANGV